MSTSSLRYHPDTWAHDPGEWWRPLTELAGTGDCGSDEWLRVLGVHEFFERPLLGQPAVLGPWLCLAAAAVSAACVRRAAEAARSEMDRVTLHTAVATGMVAFDLALSLQQRRWVGGAVSSGKTTSAELMRAGRAALRQGGHDAVHADRADAVALVAGWLAISGGLDAPLAASKITMTEAATAAAITASPDGQPDEAETPGHLVERIADRASRSRPPSLRPLIWGTAHLVERLARGAIDNLATSGQPHEPPAVASANVLLVSRKGQLGLFEARRQRSALCLAAGLAVPDLARLAFIRPSANFVDSVADSLSAAQRASRGNESLARTGEVISWNLHLAADRHPLAERRIIGRSAGLGAYVAFRSLARPGSFAARDVAFTGRVTSDGAVGTVLDAKGKIDAAIRHQIRLVVHPAGLAWQDPSIKVRLETVGLAEEAVIKSSEHLRYLRSYLEAACRLVAPEPWMRAWLARNGRPDVSVPTLNITCRQIPAGENSGAAADQPQATPDAVTVQPASAHLLALRHPNLSFAISGAAGGGSSVAAKRMVAVAARLALDDLRATRPASRSGAFILPLYLPMWEQPRSWDDLLQASVDAVPSISEPHLDTAAAIAAALRGDSGWRALVVADGTDRIGQENPSSNNRGQRDLVALLAGNSDPDIGAWQPGQPPQIVLCGRIGSRVHQQAVDSLRGLRPNSVAVMQLNPLSDKQIDRFVAEVGGGMPQLAGWNRELAANPLLLALSVVAPHPHGDHGATDLFDRGLDVLLGDRREQRAILAEIAYRAATSKGQPAGVFGVREIAAPGKLRAVKAALRADDMEGARAIALSPDERRALRSAEHDTHLLTASGTGWRFFHDRAFAFLVADRIARRAAARRPGDGQTDDDLFGVLGDHLGDAFWADVIEATGRLLELADRAPAPG